MKANSGFEFVELPVFKNSVLVSYNQNVFRPNTFSSLEVINFFEVFVQWVTCTCIGIMFIIVCNVFRH